MTIGRPYFERGSYYCGTTLVESALSECSRYKMHPNHSGARKHTPSSLLEFTLSSCLRTWASSRSWINSSNYFAAAAEAPAFNERNICDITAYANEAVHFTDDLDNWKYFTGNNQDLSFAWHVEEHFQEISISQQARRDTRSTLKEQDIKAGVVTRWREHHSRKGPLVWIPVEQKHYAEVFLRPVQSVFSSQMSK